MLLQTKELDLTLSISVTTRARRSSEVDGIHYRFITKKQFEQLRDGGDLLEWAEVHGNFVRYPARAWPNRICGKAAMFFSTSIIRGPGKSSRRRPARLSRFSSCRRR